MTFRPIYYNSLSVIEQKTVLVLGAGASAPFGFPTGQGLKDLVCEKTLRLLGSVQPLVKLGFDEDIITSFRKALLNSGRLSVDAFLEYRDDFLDIGKTAIATALLPYETTSGLFRAWTVKRMRPEPIQADNWYDLLFGVLSDGVPFDEFDKNKLYIITFNYGSYVPSTDDFLSFAWGRIVTPDSESCKREFQAVTEAWVR